MLLYRRGSGFQLEGTRRNANWVDGKWEDTHDMAMLGEEWVKKYNKEEPSPYFSGMQKIGIPVTTCFSRERNSTFLAPQIRT